MTPLLEALQAAEKAGFHAPGCARCTDGETPSAEAWGYPCAACHATGLDASDPERLIGRAMVWLRSHALNVEVRTCQWGDGIDRHVANSWFREPGKLPALEEHNGTPTGLATALLRLVARVGTPKETP